MCFVSPRLQKKYPNNSFWHYNLKTLTILYKIFVRPLLEYNTSVWSPHLLRDIDQIESVQRFFTRSLPGLSTLSYRERLNRLNLQTLEERRIHYDCIYLYKMLQNLTITPFNSMFTLKCAINLSSMSTRSTNCLALLIPKFHVDAYEHSFAIRAARYWNVLHNNVVLSHNLHLFSDHLYNFDFSVFMRGRAVKRL